MSRNLQKQPANPRHYKPFFSPDFKADLRWWYRTDSKKADKILDLVADLTFPVIFLFERSLSGHLSQSLILSSAIVIKSSLLIMAKSFKPLFCRRFQT